MTSFDLQELMKKIRILEMRVEVLETMRITERHESIHLCKREGVNGLWKCFLTLDGKYCLADKDDIPQHYFDYCIFCKTKVKK